MSKINDNTRQYDGIICIGGEDWWYHNRGHFDFQIMRRLAEDRPVLFINSLGVRMPSLGDKRLFMKRIARKLKSLRRGLQNVENNFWVFSPLSVPGKLGQAISEQTLAPQINAAAKYIGIKKPLLWMHCPAGAHLTSKLSPIATIMQRTDRFEAFPEVSDDTVARAVEHLKAVSDLTVYCNKELMTEEADEVSNACLITHGVDYEKFSTAGAKANNTPDDMKHIEGPIVGFIGGVDYHTFDPELFLGTAKRLPNCQFVLIGNCSLEEDWCTLPNVHLLGQKPYDQVADYMSACDALIMPWNKSDWIKACNPIKMKEYLATGRPVITTDFPALQPYRHLVRLADGAEEFANAITDSLMSEPMPDIARQAVKSEGWQAKVDELNNHLRQIGINFAYSTVATPKNQEYGKLNELSRAT